ncbi:ADP-ribosylglycohydrolase family protein [Kistimonas scapharcae]|uniref:ADP-ribosylglycohydrolase family protein n=1 Tax=Kistimonas scapharcae TaxID=1036133 RepID=A0ABP8UV02_9GAMM
MAGNIQAGTVLSREERIEGALLGLFVGDALGLGYHWYYDLNLLEHDVGSWVTDYLDPVVKSEHGCRHISQYRLEHGLRAGNYSQTGQILFLLLESVVEQKSFDVAVFARALDGLLSELNGEPLSGRYTEGLVRDLWQKRRQGIDWNSPELPTDADTSLGAQLCVILAALCSDRRSLAEAADRLLKVLYRDHYLRACQLVYALTVQSLIQGISLAELDETVTGMSGNPDVMGRVGSYGSLQQPGLGQIAERPEMVSVEPAKYISLVFGMDCQVTHLLPAAYYLLYRYPDSFEMAILSASNSGGENVARAALTGALVGAFHGVNAIPERFLHKLENGAAIRSYAQALAQL